MRLGGTDPDGMGCGPCFANTYRLLGRRNRDDDQDWGIQERAGLRSATANRQWPQARLCRAGLASTPECQLCARARDAGIDAAAALNNGVGDASSGRWPLYQSGHAHEAAAPCPRVRADMEQEDCRVVEDSEHSQSAVLRLEAAPRCSRCVSVHSQAVEPRLVTAPLAVELPVEVEYADVNLVDYMQLESRRLEARRARKCLRRWGWLTDLVLRTDSWALYDAVTDEWRDYQAALLLKVGDTVVTKGGGVALAGIDWKVGDWVLELGELATVADVDSDGDFRLVNPMGMVSPFLFRDRFDRVECAAPSPLLAESVSGTAVEVA